jgi:hypothetical protein
LRELDNARKGWRYFQVVKSTNAPMHIKAEQKS